MRSDNKYAWFLILSAATIILIIVGTVFLLWNPLSGTEKAAVLSAIKQNFGYLFIGALLFFSIAAFAFDAVIHLYILPLRRIVEETGLIGNANPSHRIAVEGSRDIEQLAATINAMAERFEHTTTEIDRKVVEGRSAMEDEKNVLASVISELSEGIIICNQDGQILLYNRNSQLMLAPPTSGDSKDETAAPSHGAYIGIGRSIFYHIKRHQLDHAIQDISARLDAPDTDAVAYFVAVNAGGQKLRVEMVPILDQSKDFTAYVLILHDITRQLASASQATLAIENLAKGIRGSLGSIRTTIETILNYPEMEPQRLDQFRNIIHSESIVLEKILTQATSEHEVRQQNRWPLTTISIEELWRLLKNRTAQHVALIIEHRENEQQIHVAVDGYVLVFAILMVLLSVQRQTGCNTFTGHFHKKNQRVHLDFRWRGPSLKIEDLRKWGQQHLNIADEELPFTLNDVLHHHDAELWPFTNLHKDRSSHLRLFLPEGHKKAHRPQRKVAILSSSRPEFYDFDLFNQPGQRPDQDNCRLSELSFTVFDTETTGLNPQKDEIVAIGAVRVVNGRLLQNEIFDQLVNPKRSIPLKATQIHGITNEMVLGQPDVNQALSQFERFVEGTILVAHNAAFDMRMLQIKEPQSKIRFINPVLDTLLISATVHSNQENHYLETLARMLGVPIVDRHTALGDALVTARIFLKMIPILETNGIHTLGEARRASQKSYLARLKF